MTDPEEGHRRNSSLRLQRKFSRAEDPLRRTVSVTSALRRQRLMQRQTTLASECTSREASFEDVDTSSTWAGFRCGTPPPPDFNKIPERDSKFLSPPTPFEVGLTYGEAPPHRRVGIIFY